MDRTLKGVQTLAAGSDIKNSDNAVDGAACEVLAVGTLAAQ